MFLQASLKAVLNRFKENVLQTRFCYSKECLHDIIVLFVIVAFLFGSIVMLPVWVLVAATAQQKCKYCVVYGIITK